MKNKKTLILLLSIMIIVVIYLIFKVFSIQNSNESNNQIAQNKVQEKNQTVEKKIVDSYEIYYSVMNAVQKYILYNSNNDKEAVYALLDKNYIADNGITKENVIEKVKKIEKTELLIKEMYCEETNDYNKKYYVHAYIYEYNENEYDTTYNGDIERNYEEFNICVLVDEFNSTFSVIPQE